MNIQILNSRFSYRGGVGCLMILTWCLLMPAPPSRAQAEPARIEEEAAPRQEPASPPLDGAKKPVAVPPAFADFTAWVQKYRESKSPADKTALEAPGVALAQKRRAALARLIDTDPRRALELALPEPARAAVPPSVARYLEERVSGRGEFQVLAIDRIDPDTGAMVGEIERSVQIGDKNYRARVYGRRATLTSKNNIPLHGIVLDRTMAVHESPVRVLDDGETPDPKAPLAPLGKKCPVCGMDAAQGVVADIGGVIFYFDTQEDLEKHRAGMEQREDVIGPDVAEPQK